MSVVSDLATPIIVAPMAGGPSTPELVIAADQAGGLGFLAIGTLSVEQATDQMAACTGYNYGVNLFAEQTPLADLSEVETVLGQLAAEYERANLAAPSMPEVDYTNGWDEKLAAVEAAVLEGRGPSVISSTFGPFNRREVTRFRDLGVEVWISVASPEDAVTAQGLGADAVVVQGPEAGGHRYTWEVEVEPDGRDLDSLLAAVRAAGVTVPMIAAGGIATPRAVSHFVAQDGVAGVSCGTAFLLADEAGTSELNREILAEEDLRTVSTRAFSGRYARGAATAFTDQHPDMPAIYPYLNPLLARWRNVGTRTVAYCLVGSNNSQLRAQPARAIMEWLASGNGN